MTSVESAANLQLLADYLDIPAAHTYAYPYERFKADLSEQSQAMLTADHENAAWFKSDGFRVT